MLKINVSPHIHSNESIERSMWNVNIALIPALLASISFFGLRALWVVLVSVGTAVLFEVIMQLLLKKKITVLDGSAVVTGILVAFNMPPSIPFYIPIVGTVFAIVIVKHLFGGLGNNIFNPALAGRVFVMFAWTVDMTTWTIPLNPEWLNNFNIQAITNAADGVTAATPLAVNKVKGVTELIKWFGTKTNLYMSLAAGNVMGSIGETSAIALFIGGMYLVVRKIMKPIIPLLYIAVVFGIAALVGQDPMFHILAGGLFLGAIFMATDYVTNPFTIKGKIIYAVGCGLVTILLRLKSGMPEGVSFSILLMNALTPLIDRYTKPKIFGTRKK